MTISSPIMMPASAPVPVRGARGVSSRASSATAASQSGPSRMPVGLDSQMYGRGGLVGWWRWLSSRDWSASIPGRPSPAWLASRKLRFPDICRFAMEPFGASESAYLT